MLIYAQSTRLYLAWRPAGMKPETTVTGTYNFIVTTNIWVNYDELTATSLEIMVSKGNHPQMALIQVSELF